MSHSDLGNAPVTHRGISAASILLVASDRLGDGPEELGRVLIRSFFKTLRDLERKPRRVIFLNTGVNLVLDGSPVLEDLRALEASGTEVLACGTCLDFFQAKDRVRAGHISNMNEIASTLMSAERVVRL